MVKAYYNRIRMIMNGMWRLFGKFHRILSSRDLRHSFSNRRDVMRKYNIFHNGFFSELISINSIFQFLLATFSLIFDDQSRNICLSSIFCGFYFFFVLSFSFHSLALYFGRVKHVITKCLITFYMYGYTSEDKKNI